MKPIGSIDETPVGGPANPPRKARILSAAILRILRVVGLIAGGSLVVLYFLQDRIIFPGAATQGRPESRVYPRNGAELVEIKPPGGDRIVAIFGPALAPDGHALENPETRPALIYFYGNAMCLAYSDQEFDRFRRLGLNVLIPDYLGYGMSEGQASELGCRLTAEACFDNLRSRGFPAQRIIAAGWSLGGAVAIDLAARRQLGGLIAFSTFTSARDMGKTLFPVALPRWFFAHRFESLRKIGSIGCPILLGHGRRDSLIPFSMFEQLLAATNPAASRIIIDQADHNDFYDVGGKSLFEAISRFLEETQHGR
jgi:pimeloyl-ACP methyl ester carboxylesterase